MKNQINKYLLPATAFLDGGKVRYQDERADVVDHLGTIEVTTLYFVYV